MSPYPKIKRLSDKKYLAWLHTQPCAICGRGPCEAAHQRLLGGGTGRKPDDKFALPECFDCHRLGEHAINGGIVTVWNRRSGLKFEGKHDLRDHLRLLCETYYDEYKNAR